MEINCHKAGLTLGGFIGLWHVLWALFVAVGFAQPLLDFVLGLHFLRNPYMVEPFRIGTAALLVIVTAGVGYAFGWVFASIWNRLQKGKM